MVDMKIVAVPSDQFTFQKEQLWIYIICLASCIMYIVVAYAITMRIRMQVFDRKFMEQFDKEHAEAFGTEGFGSSKQAPEFGFPDSGNGRFAKKLPYADWFRMNNGQRCQVNFLEHITFAILGPVVGGFAYAWWGLGCAILIFVGRLIFTIGYSIGGPGWRIPGALLMDLGLFASFILLMIASIKLGVNQ